MILYFLLGLFLFILGAGMAFAPDKVWGVFESWRSNATEPSDFYRRYYRGIGVVVMACGLGAIVFAVVTLVSEAP